MADPIVNSNPNPNQASPAPVPSPTPTPVVGSTIPPAAQKTLTQQEEFALQKQGQATGDFAKTKTLDEVVVTSNARSRKKSARGKQVKVLNELKGVTPTNYPYPNSPMGNFLQNATTRAIIISKDIKKVIVKSSDKVEAINEIDLCNLISYFLTQALPSGSNVEQQFQKVKEQSAELLQKIEETEQKIISQPLSKSSIAAPANALTGSVTGSSATTNVNSGTPAPTNIQAQNPNYGGSGTFNTPPTPAVQSITGGNNGTSATIGSTLDAIRSVKGIIDSFNIPTPVLKIIPGGNKLLNSLKRINEQIPTNISNFPNQDLQKITQTFSELKSILSGISTAENPADLLAVFQAKNAITKLQDKLNPTQLIPTLNAIVKSLEILSQVLNTITSYLGKITTVVRTLNTIVQVFKVLIKFIRKLPLPARWSTVGVIATLSNIADKLEKKVEQISSILAQASFFLSTFNSIISGINRKLAVLVLDLRILLQNLEKCKKTSNLPVTKQLKEAILTLENSLSALEAVLPVANPNKKIIYKGFTLKIVEEQIIDKGIPVNRRYGVALDSRGVVVIQTKLTYATNLDLIRNELRYLIDANNLNADLNTLNTISEQDQILAELDLPSEEEQNAELAATQSEINNLVKQIAPEEKLKKERNKKDKRKFRRLVRVIRKLRTKIVFNLEDAILGQGPVKEVYLTKEQIKNRVLNNKIFDQFDETDFEEAWKASENNTINI
jgi:hypothetical protein